MVACVDSFEALSKDSSEDIAGILCPSAQAYGRETIAAEAVHIESGIGKDSLDRGARGGTRGMEHMGHGQDGHCESELPAAPAI